MKFYTVLICLFCFNLLFANPFVDELEIIVHSGYCTSASSGQAIIEVSGGTPPYTFEWSDPNLEGDEVYDLEPGNYSLTVTDATACTANGSFVIPANSDLQINFEIDDISCYGETDGRITITDFSPPDLLFSIDGVNFSEATIFENLSASDFMIYILESNGCITLKLLAVLEPPRLLVDLGPDIQVNLGEEVQIDAQVNTFLNNLTLEWSSSQPLSCTDCLDPTITPLETLTILLIVHDENGCTASDQITIHVVKPDGLFIPNAFSPNYDGINDVFYLFGGSGIVQIQRFIIRDNFGGIVFEIHNFQPNELNLGWDGTLKGKKLQRGVFIYQVTVEYVDGSLEDFFGTVTLLE